MPGDGGSGTDSGGRCAGLETGWSVSVEWAGRSRAVYVCRGFNSAADGKNADLWHLPGTSAHRHCAGREDLQAEVWTPRRESSGEAVGHGEDRDRKSTRLNSSH